MLSRLYRLTQARDFKRVYTTGRNVNGRCLRLKMAMGDLPHPRIAIVVANAVSKRATERNRIKRLMREAVRELLPHIRKGADIVLSANVSAVNIDLLQASNEIRGLLERAKLLV